MQWNDENIYCSSAFVSPHPVNSVDELAKGAGGADMLAAYLAFCRDAPMVVSTAPGIEEAFGQFVPATDDAIAGMKAAVDHIRAATNKPVMVGHGGYWNRLDFERVPFFDIYDPETEPFYPAAVHVELAPLVARQKKAMWLRPQMYENVPYERWRYHVWVEMMRGASRVADRSWPERPDDVPRPARRDGVHQSGGLFAGSRPEGVDRTGDRTLVASPRRQTLHRRRHHAWADVGQLALSRRG